MITLSARPALSRPVAVAAATGLIMTSALAHSAEVTRAPHPGGVAMVCPLSSVGTQAFPLRRPDPRPPCPGPIR